MFKGRIMSGMRPTGKLHLGHLLGALENWVKLQEEYECFYVVVDWHALTTRLDTSHIKEYIREVIIDWLSVGIDPKKSTIVIQSQVPELAELHVFLSMVTPVPWLERCPTFKEQIRQLHLGSNFSYGFLGYPVLMASDILLYKANLVPVGKDQIPHLEIAREIARRFNHLYREVFPEPQPVLTEAPLLIGLDGRKMSKSYGNYILISDEPAEIRKKVRSMVTDPQRIRRTDPGHPRVCTVYSYHKIFNTSEAKGIGRKCRGAEIGCTDCKEILAKHLIQFLSPIQAERKSLEANPQLVDEILAQGMEKARKIAQGTIQEVREAMKM